MPTRHSIWGADERIGERLAFGSHRTTALRTAAHHCQFMSGTSVLCRPDVNIQSRPLQSAVAHSDPGLEGGTLLSLQPRPDSTRGPKEAQPKSSCAGAHKHIHQYIGIPHGHILRVQ